MLGKLPFVGRIFWKVLVVVFVLGGATFAILVGTEVWEFNRTNVVGASLCLLIFSYLVHLWLLPGEHPQPDDELGLGSEASRDAEGSPGDEDSPAED